MLSIGSILTPTLDAAILIIAGCIIFSVASFYIARRFLKGVRKEENNDFTQLVFSVVATLYAILLGFVVVIAWQNFTDAQTNTTAEVTSVSNILRDAGGFAPGARMEVRSDLINYLYRVANDEWPALADGNSDQTTESAYSQIWDALYAYRPHTTQAETFYSEAVEQLNAVAQARNQRILSSNSMIPTPLWILLLAGGAITILFTHVFWTRTVRAHIVGSIILGGLLGLVIFLIYALQHPFTGDIKISEGPYLDLAKEWANRPL